MDFNLSEEERALQDTARKFAREVMRPRSAHHDETGTFPREIIQQAAELGLMNMTLPTEVGGNHLSHFA